jgi:hypothetical protein
MPEGTQEYRFGFIATIADAERVPTYAEMREYLERAVMVDLNYEDEEQAPEDTGEDAAVSCGVIFRPPLLEPDDSLDERGNTLLVNDGDDMLAWLDLVGNHRLQVSYCPGNHPALNVGVVELTEEQLAAHINSRCAGWLVRKCNCDGVNIVGGYVAEPPDAEERPVTIPPQQREPTVADLGDALVQDATYTSVWDNGSTVPSACKYDPVAKRVHSIETADVTVEGTLEDEYVTLTDGTELREADGVVFDY